jgi:tetratricopeptide (TPR) repeat protein
MGFAVFLILDLIYLKYVPDLIPKEYQVEIDPPAILSSNSGSSYVKKISSYVAAGIFFVISLGTIFVRFGEGLTALVIGLLLVPKIHLWVEDKLRFNFTLLIKSITVTILIAALLAFSARYNRLDREKAERMQAENTRVAAEKEKFRQEVAQRQKQLNDTLFYFRSKAEAEINKQRYASAVSLLSQGLTFDPKQENLIALRAEANYRSGAYRDAVADYSKLIQSNPNTFDDYYKRANCHLKLGDKALAIADLKHAIGNGNEKARQLHEKINPLKRRIVGYVTRCCDGSTSGAKGRGACSHHGGVCDWNDPIYQEYREFE